MGGALEPDPAIGNEGVELVERVHRGVLAVAVASVGRGEWVVRS